MTRMLMGCLAVMAAGLGLAGSGVAVAAEVPAAFRGVWTIAVGAYDQCKKRDWDAGRRTDAMMSVNAGSIRYWESRCKVVSAKKLAESTVALTLACAGEGMRWRAKEVWYVQKIDARKQLVTVSLGTSDLRDHTGKPAKNPVKNKISVTINLACN